MKKARLRTFKIEPKSLEKGKDGLYRFVIGTYDHPCKQDQFVRNLENVTGVKWKWLGTMMDTACFATKTPLTKAFDVPYPL